MKRAFYIMVVILAQFALLAGLVAWYSMPFWVEDAVEVTVRTEPVDPRDPFRGDYVILNYPFSRLTDKELKDSTPYRNLRGRRVYTILKQAPGTHFWEMEKQTFDFPGENHQGADSVAIRGLIPNVGWSWGTPIRYGIEQFFLQEGTGRAIEEAMRNARDQQTVEVTLRVLPSGRAAVKSVKVVPPDREAKIEIMPTELYN